MPGTLPTELWPRPPKLDPLQPGNPLCCPVSAQVRILLHCLCAANNEELFRLLPPAQLLSRLACICSPLGADVCPCCVPVKRSPGGPWLAGYLMPAALQVEALVLQGTLLSARLLIQSLIKHFFGIWEFCGPLEAGLEDPGC